MDGTYAPQSPDLSGLQTSPSKQQLYHPSQSSYAPQSPVIPSYNPQQYPAYEQSDLQPNSGYELSEYGNSTYMPPIPDLPPTHSFNAPPSSNYYPPPLKQESYNTNFDNTTYEVKPEYSSNIKLEYPPLNDMSSRIARPPHITGDASTATYKNPNPTNIEIRTKFPVARIKRIMQADEEVGKVAQVTPVAVNKALELFMIALVTGAAEKAKEKGGKRVTAQHLKAVVEGDEQFDFLKEIVERVADVQESAGGEGRKKKKDVGSDSDEDEGKKKKGKGRRKKSDE